MVRFRQKLKESITDADKPDKALERINAIRRRFFAWKADGREDIGVIAQELAEIDPRYVYECGMIGESILGVSQTALISDLIGAVKNGGITVRLKNGGGIPLLRRVNLYQTDNQQEAGYGNYFDASWKAHLHWQSESDLR